MLAAGHFISLGFLHYTLVHRANAVVTSNEVLKPYNLSIGDLVSYSIRPLPFVTPRMLACYTMDPLPPNTLPGTEKIVRVINFFPLSHISYISLPTIFFPGQHWSQDPWACGEGWGDNGCYGAWEECSHTQPARHARCSWRPLRQPHPQRCHHWRQLWALPGEIREIPGQITDLMSIE